jgi:hypothetical protein
MLTSAFDPERTLILMARRRAFSISVCLSVGIAAASLFAAGPALSASGTINDNELSLSGVALGDSEEGVRSLLGEPKERFDTGEGTEFRYTGLTVSIGWLEQQAPGKQRRVWALRGTGPAACTPAGICPGMAFERARATYGVPVLARRDYGTFMEYYSSESSCWLQLDVSGGVIRAIGAVCQP